MGKAEEVQQLPPTLGSELTNQNVGGRCGHGYDKIRRLIGFRCVLVLALSAAVFLSAIFGLHPFFRSSDQKVLDLDSKFKDHEIVASFNVEKPVSFLEDHILQLENDILGEIYVPSAKVVILSMEPLAGSNETKIIFAVDPDRNYSEITEMSLSLIRASFESLVINHPPLRLSTALFGDPVSFQVLKFDGGITIIPPQSAFLLQKVQIDFNFTLNFSVYQIQLKFDELRSQLTLGLNLAPYENMYISLSNSRGSTVDAPTIVRPSVLLTVGNTPLTRRLKQLAQTITSSQPKNLGLNNTTFGKVKQVHLSSILRHSLTGCNGNSPTPSPSPAPSPGAYHHHHLHRHHHHRHYHGGNLAPDISPSPSTSEMGPSPSSQISAAPPEDGTLGPRISSFPPERSHEGKPPSCQDHYKRTSEKARKPADFAPAPSPNISPGYPAASPPVHTDSSAPSPSAPASSPLRNVAYAHLQPPSTSDHGSETADTAPSVAPSPSLSSLTPPDRLWTISLIFFAVLRL